MAKYTGKIYLAGSDKARLADCRVRIVKESDPMEPCDNADLVFEKADDESLIPADALFKWNIMLPGGRQWFYTTAERCKQMVSEDPSYWTKEKLEEFARIEGRFYRDWRDGNVYGYVVETWDNAQRMWKTTSSAYGMYGADELLENVKDIVAKYKYEPIVCIDEELKYDFDNTEKQPNEFK